MSENELIKEINDELTLSCALPYSINAAEAARVIKRAREWAWVNYQYAVEDRLIALPTDIFGHASFRSTRQIQLPECVVSVWELKETTGFGAAGAVDRDFGENKLIGSEIHLNPFMGDNLLYRTVMYSYYDLAKAYTLEHIAFSWNSNTRRITVAGRIPTRDAYARAYVRIPEESLYDDELFVRYVLAQAKIQLGRLLGQFTYNLPGGIQINFADIKAQGKEELTEILKQVDGDNSPDWMLWYN